MIIDVIHYDHKYLPDKNNKRPNLQAGRLDKTENFATNP
jgi:hypothetical protein